MGRVVLIVVIRLVWVLLVISVILDRLWVIRLWKNVS